MVDHISGDAPVKRGPAHRIIRVTTSDSKMFFVVSRAVFGQNIHWAFNRSHECKHDKAACDGCTKLWPSKWLGYLCVIVAHSQEVCFLELTLTAVEMLLSQAPKDKSLRGLIIDVSKSKGGPKGRYKISVKERIIPEDELPAELDPLPVLRYLWNCKKPTGNGRMF